MRRTPARAGTRLAAALLAAGLVAGCAGHDPAAPAAPTGAAVTPRPGSAPDPTDPGRAGDLTWAPGPWGETVVAGHRLLLPASPTHGPLRDRGDGWASDYAPTPTGAAVALLRGPWLVFAAPPSLRAAVLATVLTPAAAAEPGPVNPTPGWALPGELLTALAAQDVRLLGADAQLTDDNHASVTVYQQTANPAGPVVVRSTHHLTYTDQQWLIEADYSDGTGEQIPLTDTPTVFTVPGPGAR